MHTRIYRILIPRVSTLVLAAMVPSMLSGCQIGSIMSSGAIKVARAVLANRDATPSQPAEPQFTAPLPSFTALRPTMTPSMDTSPRQFPKVDNLVEPTWGKDWVQVIDVLRAYIAAGGPETDHAKQRLYDALINYGVLLREINQPLDAIETWRQATEVDATRPEALALMAQTRGTSTEASPTPGASPTAGETPSPGRSPSPTVAPTATEEVPPQPSPSATMDTTPVGQPRDSATQTVIARATAAARATTEAQATRTAQSAAQAERTIATRQAAAQRTATIAAVFTQDARIRSEDAAASTRTTVALNMTATYVSAASAQLTLTAAAMSAPVATPVPPSPTSPPPPTAVPTNTPVPVPTNTPVPAPTNTPVPPTVAPPTNTAQPSATVQLQAVVRRAPAQDAILNNGSSVTFAWNRSPGAAKYRLQLWQVDYTNDFEFDILVDGLDYTIVMPDKNGPWMWRVIAVSRDGKLGPLSSYENRFVIK